MRPPTPSFCHAFEAWRYHGPRRRRPPNLVVTRPVPQLVFSLGLPPLLPALVLSDPQLGGAGPDRDRAALIMICDGMDIRDTFSVCLETYTRDP